MAASCDTELGTVNQLFQTVMLQPSPWLVDCSDSTDLADGLLPTQLFHSESLHNASIAKMTTSTATMSLNKRPAPKRKKRLAAKKKPPTASKVYVDGNGSITVKVPLDALAKRKKKSSTSDFLLPSKAAALPKSRSNAMKPFPKNSKNLFSDHRIREIFDCVHFNRLPTTENTQFRIVPGVGPNKLSPPPLCFEVGLYILLQPRKNEVPSNLTSLLMNAEESETFSWTVSGPQAKSVANGIMLRYAYPKDRKTSTKGATMFTLIGSNGKEDKRYRLLHVYPSRMRAANQQIEAHTEASCDDDAMKKASPQPTKCVAPRSTAKLWDTPLDSPSDFFTFGGFDFDSGESIPSVSKSAVRALIHTSKFDRIASIDIASLENCHYRDDDTASMLDDVSREGSKGNLPLKKRWFPSKRELDDSQVRKNNAATFDMMKSIGKCSHALIKDSATCQNLPHSPSTAPIGRSAQKKDITRMSSARLACTLAEQLMDLLPRNESFAAQDYLYLGTMLADKQKAFAATGKPTKVKLAYHVTTIDSSNSICQFGLTSFSKPWGKSVFDTFGKGVYTKDNPYGISGEIGIIVAVLQGVVARVGPDELDSDKNIDTVIGNSRLSTWKTCSLDPLEHDEIILKSESQCLPLAVYPGALFSDGDGAQQDIQAFFSRCAQLKELVDQFFNTSQATTPSSHLGLMTGSLRRERIAKQQSVSETMAPVDVLSSPPAKRSVPSNTKTPTLIREAKSKPLFVVTDPEDDAIETLQYRALTKSSSTCPPGVMAIRRERRDDSTKCFVITWTLDMGAEFEARTPDSAGGLQLLKRLKCAWMCGLVFKLDGRNEALLMFKSVVEFWFTEESFLWNCNKELDRYGVPSSSLVATVKTSSSDSTTADRVCSV